MKAGLLLRTLAHLRWEQMVYRPMRIAQKRFYNLSPISSKWTRDLEVKAPSARAVERIRAVFVSLPHLNSPLSEYEGRLGDLRDDRFTFLNRTLTLNPLEWNVRHESHLWNYNLHYFGYAIPCARAYVELGDESALATLERLIPGWIAQAKMGVSDGWDAYPVSLRIVNWIYAYALVAGRGGDGRFLAKWSASIYRQLDFLSRQIEYQLLANHVIKNAKALVIGGLMFAHPVWLSQGKKLLWRELEEQVLADGGHCERAPMYHALALADFLECLMLLKALDHIDEKRSQNMAIKLARMAEFLAAMSYPDGTIALFNDSANTEESRPKPLLASVAVAQDHVGANSVLTFAETGYFLWADKNGSERIVVDAGPPSVDYNAAHAHCDLLSYELWLGGRPFVVDSGVHGYEGDRFREYARSTRAHNTVLFDGREQSEVWGTFRMARRAEVVSAEAVGDGDAWRFRGSYSPYFNRRLVHERRIERTPEGEWVVIDCARGGVARVAESFIHLHPDVRARKLDVLKIECESSSARVIIEPFGAESVEVITGADEPAQGWYFPDFGIARPSSTICMRSQVKEGEEFGYRIRRE